MTNSPQHSRFKSRARSGQIHGFLLDVPVAFVWEYVGGHEKLGKGGCRERIRNACLAQCGGGVQAVRFTFYTTLQY